MFLERIFNYICTKGLQGLSHPESTRCTQATRNIFRVNGGPSLPTPSPSQAHTWLSEETHVVNVDVPTWPHCGTLSPTPGATRSRRTCLCVLPVGRRSHGVVLWVGDTEQTASDLHVQLAVLRGPLVSTSESNRETATQGALSTDIPASFGLCCAYLYSCPSL